jgi:hypothetical protein
MLVWFPNAEERMKAAVLIVAALGAVGAIFGGCFLVYTGLAAVHPGLGKAFVGFLALVAGAWVLAGIAAADL